VRRDVENEGMGLLVERWVGNMGGRMIAEC